MNKHLTDYASITDYEGIVAFSVQQISFMLQLPRSSVAQYCKEGLLPCFKVGRHYRVLKADLLDFLEERKASLAL